MAFSRRNLRRLFPSFLTFAVVVLTLEAQSIWWDEGISLHLAGVPWRQLLADRAANIHPPLYFVLLKAWLALTGLTPFSGRYLSALAVTLLPATAYRFVSRRAGSRSGRVAAVLLSLAPPLIVYGQEVRAYALLPMGVLVLWSLAWPASDDGDGERISKSVYRLVLGAVQAGLVLTHYVGVVACGAAALWVIIRAFRTSARADRRRLLGRWAQGLAVAAALVAPWAGFVVATGLQRLTVQAGLANPTATPVTAGYVAGMLGLFHTTAQPAALGDRTLVRSSILVGLFLLLGVLMGMWHRQGRAAMGARAVGASLFFWLVPFAVAPAIWALSPQSHPRYLYAFVVGGWMTAALVVARPVRSRGWLRCAGYALRLGLLAAVLVTSVLGLRAYAVEPRYARSDVRAVAAFLRDQSGPGDVVVVPATDWSLEQYEVGSARIVMAPEASAWEGALGPFAAQVGAAPMVYVMDYGRDAVDPRDALRAALTSSGVLVERHAFQGVTLEAYALAETLRQPAMRPVERTCAADEGLCLEAASYAARPVSGAALPVALRWVGVTPGVRFGVALRLYAPSGALVAAVAEPLIDAGLAPTDGWAGDGAVTSYHIVPLPVGLLPVGYRLEIGLYDTAVPDRTIVLNATSGAPLPALRLGEVTPLLEPWRDTSAYGLSDLAPVVGVETAPGLWLDAVSIDRAAASPGETLFVSTLWRASAASEDVVGAEVALEQGDVVLGSVPLRVADSSVPAGRPLLHSVALTVPANAEDGEARVVVRVAGRSLTVGGVTLAAVGHLFTAPPADYRLNVRAGDVATLVGFTLDPDTTVVAGAPLTLTLQWEAGPAAAGADLKAFVHLAVDDEIVAQHDAVPANWSRPTTGWIPGEIVIDEHGLAWKSGDTSGSARLLIGLYDGVTGQRVVWEDGSDATVLPIEVVVRVLR